MDQESVLFLATSGVSIVHRFPLTNRETQANYWNAFIARESDLIHINLVFFCYPETRTIPNVRIVRRPHAGGAVLFLHIYTCVFPFVRKFKETVIAGANIFVTRIPKHGIRNPKPETGNHENDDSFSSRTFSAYRKRRTEIAKRFRLSPVPSELKTGNLPQNFPPPHKTG